MVEVTNDVEIRHRFHRRRLAKYHAAPDTLVVDELGLKHGRCRADIAVVNGRLVGYEIKSDKDNLSRLGEQIRSYNDVFDFSTIVLGAKHLAAASALVPDWWGIVVANQGPRGGIQFTTVRRPHINRETNLHAIAQLLWKDEAAEILTELGVPKSTLRQPRSVLYSLLVESLSPSQLRSHVRSCLKSRKNWRCPTPPSPYGGSSPLCAR